MAIEIPELKLAYMAVPKAACSTVKAGLALVDPNKDVTLEDMAADNRLVHRVYATDRFRNWQWRSLRDHYRFTVVRDPIKRLMSVFTNRVQQKGELMNSRRLRRDQDRLPRNPDPDFFYQNLLDYMQYSSSIRHHALQSFHFTGKNLSRYDRVYRTEDMKHLERDLSERTGKDVVMPRLNKSPGGLKFDDLKPKTRDGIIAFLKPDYDVLRDYYPAP